MSDLPINQIICGDCREVMRTWPDGCVHCVVTSPPYYGLRCYGVEPSVWAPPQAESDDWRTCVHQWESHVQPAANGITHDGGMTGDTLSGKSATRKPKKSDFCSKCGAWRGCYGLEPTIELYVQHTVEIFREVRRVLRDDGTLWLNIGDSYNAAGRNGHGARVGYKQGTNRASATGQDSPRPSSDALKEKDLCMIPARVALALQADGWYLRQDIIWHKPNPMPESVSDRCTKAHEYLFLLSKSPMYYYDAEAIKEAPSGVSGGLVFGGKNKGVAKRGNGIRISGREFSREDRERYMTEGANKRSVWTVATAPFKAAHFATFPPELIRPCIRAGTSQKGCCPKCGAPWVRVVEKSKTFQSGSERSGNRIKGKQDLSASDKNSTPDVRMGPCNESRTIGWEPSCGCEAADSVPCVVIDPFGGSGTTGMVAAQEGRDYILIEKNPEYVEMARVERLAAVETGVPVSEARAGQLSLFNQDAETPRKAPSGTPVPLSGGK